MKLTTITLAALLVLDLPLIGCENSVDPSAARAVATFQVARDTLRPGASDAMLEFEVDKAQDDVYAFRETQDYKRYPKLAFQLDRALTSFQTLVLIQKFARKTGDVKIDLDLADCSRGTAAYMCKQFPKYVLGDEKGGKRWFDWDTAKTDSTDFAIDSTAYAADFLQKPE